MPVCPTGRIKVWELAGPKLIDEKHEKEEKLAGPTGNFAGPAPFLVAEGLGPVLNAKTAYYCQ